MAGNEYLKQVGESVCPQSVEEVRREIKESFYWTPSNYALSKKLKDYLEKIWPRKIGKTDEKEGGL